MYSRSSPPLVHFLAHLASLRDTIFLLSPARHHSLKSQRSLRRATSHFYCFSLFSLSMLPSASWRSWRLCERHNLLLSPARYHSLKAQRSQRKTDSSCSLFAPPSGDVWHLVPNSDELTCEAVSSQTPTNCLVRQYALTQAARIARDDIPIRGPETRIACSRWRPGSPTSTEPGTANCAG